MADLPRLPPKAEHRLIKRLCELAPSVQRRLFGAPPQSEGQTLASDIHVLLQLAKLAGSPSFLAGMTVEQARASARHEAAVIGSNPPIPMARLEPVEVPGPGGPLAARLYVPLGLPAGEAPPLLVYFHGGGWVIGDLETHDGTCRFLAAAAGVAVLSIDYRLAPEHPFPAPVEDAWAAFAWAAANAESLGADPTRIAVGGDSAGGNLSAVVSLLAREGGGVKPAMQLLIYPVTDSAETPRSRHTYAEGFFLTRADMELFEQAYLPPGTDADDPRISIFKAPDLRNLPPAYVTTAGFDPLRDEGEAFALRMREAGVEVALRRHPGLVHSFANLTAVSRTSRAAMREAAGALRMGLASAGR